MNLREELQKKYRRAIDEEKKKRAEYEENIKKKAEKFIKEIVILRLRELNEQYPTESYLEIAFEDNIGGLVCSTYPGNSGRDKCSFESEVIEEAIKIANNYGIEASEKDDGGGGTIYSFSLDLD